MTKKIKVCATCGSADVIADATARWNVAFQQWEVANIMDEGHSCDDCADDCEIETIDLAEYEERQLAAAEAEREALP